MHCSHDQMVASTISYLQTNFYSNIKADLNGFIQPEKIIWTNSQKGHIPDITAQRNGLSYIFEIETQDSISLQHSEDQWILFSAFASQHNSNFCLVVPEKQQFQTQQRISALGINAQILTFRE